MLHPGERTVAAEVADDALAVDVHMTKTHSSHRTIKSLQNNL